MATKKATVGTEPMLGTRPSVTIEDRAGNETVYELKSLGIQDTFGLAQIIAKGAGYMGSSLGNLTEADPQTVALLLVAGLPYAENEAIKILARVIGVSQEDLRNPDKFPMGTEIEIIYALSQHQDLTSFFGKIKRLIATIPQMNGLLSAQSTKSNKDTDGQTK